MGSLRNYFMGAKPICPQCGRRINNFAANTKVAIAECKRIRRAKHQKPCRSTR